jgi:DNA-binding response OmpR family regulator
MMSQHTVLIVDDDSHIREVLRYALEKEDIAVIEAENGQKGLEKALSQAPDMIVLECHDA